MDTIKVKKDKELRVRMSPVELIEVKIKAKEAGFSDVATYIRFLLRERQAIDAFKIDKAREIVGELKRFGIGLAMLRANGLDE